MIFSLFPGLMGLPPELHLYCIGAGCNGVTVFTVGFMVGRFVTRVLNGLGACLVPEAKIV